MQGVFFFADRDPLAAVYENWPAAILSQEKRACRPVESCLMNNAYYLTRCTISFMH